MGRIDQVYRMLEIHAKDKAGLTALELGQLLTLDRATVSRYLNRLSDAGRVEKLSGRPVRYRLWAGGTAAPVRAEALPTQANSLDDMIGADSSLQMAVQQAKAAILYPPRGLHVLILGETGVGKSMFAEAMCAFAREMHIIDEKAPFVRFNCADYADNPQLLSAQIFGVKKGAYSGADADREGLLKKADGGIFFLDEVHRLSAQGQEMLFTFIDKGCFRPLGETTRMVHSSVQLIAATTEDPESHLLATFTRRIPMTIPLPALRERSLEERYGLIREFIQSEARRLQKDIYVQYNAMVSLLLYSCPNNIGQLRSDIQLACAKAFLYFRSEVQPYIIIKQEELAARVKRGILELCEHREAVKKLMDKKEEILVFSPDNPELAAALPVEDPAGQEEIFFYDGLLKKMDSLRAQGMEEPEIQKLLNLDMEEYFKRYLSNLPVKFRREELLKVVSAEVVDTVEELLGFAEKTLQREFDEKVYCGFALHLGKSLERIRFGCGIYYPRLENVRKTYAAEFAAATQMARQIEKKFRIDVPFDEIGYIAMFLTPAAARRQAVRGRVQILLLMHGNATASSMAQVANSLTGEELVHGMDMPLSMKVADMYQAVRDVLRGMDTSCGVLLLVDMGSLNNFADMLHEELGIAVRSLDLVSTPIVIEACHKAVDGSSLQEVYQECCSYGKYHVTEVREKGAVRPLLIITACFTGAGAALYLKEYLEKNLAGEELVEIQAMNIIDRNDFLCRVQTLSSKYNIIAVAGTVDFSIERIPFFAAAEVLEAKGILRLRRLIEQERNYQKIKLSLQQHVKDIDAGGIINDVREILRRWGSLQGGQLPDEVQTGIVIHMLFMMDRIVHQQELEKFPDCEAYLAAHAEAYQRLQKLCRRLEHRCHVEIPTSELAHVLRMCLQNWEG